MPAALAMLGAIMALVWPDCVVLMEGRNRDVQSVYECFVNVVYISLSTVDFHTDRLDCVIKWKKRS